MPRPLLSLLLAVLVGAPAAAQPLSQFESMFDGPPLVEVNLRGSLLKLASAAASGEAPDAAAMLDGVRSVTVRVFPQGAARSGLQSSLDAFGEQFERTGWYTMVRVRPNPADSTENDDVWVYVRDDGDLFDGLAVMAVDDEDETAVFVMIDGTIDPAQVAALSRRFANVRLDGDADGWDDED